MDEPNEKGPQEKYERRDWLTELEQRPISDLGRRLIAIRREIEASGEKLLTSEEIDREIAEARGGICP